MLSMMHDDLLALSSLMRDLLVLDRLEERSHEILEGLDLPGELCSLSARLETESRRDALLESAADENHANHIREQAILLPSCPDDAHVNSVLDEIESTAKLIIAACDTADVET